MGYPVCPNRIHSSGKNGPWKSLFETTKSFLGDSHRLKLFLAVWESGDNRCEGKPTLYSTPSPCNSVSKHFRKPPMLRNCSLFKKNTMRVGKCQEKFMMLSETSGWIQSDYLSLIKMFPICGNMLLETDELAQSRVSTWECSKFNKAIQAGGKEFFRFCYFKDALASLRV